MARLSIIIVTFNNYEELLSTVQSIPERKEFELVVVNGGSCDRTKNYLADFSRGPSISEPDHGISDAFNKGFTLSSGDFFVYINSGDTLIDPSYLDEAFRVLSENDTIAFTYSDIAFGHSEIGEISVKAKALDHSGLPFSHQTLVTRRSIIDSYPLFSTGYRYAMDFDFFCKFIVTRNLKGHYIEKRSVRMDGGGVTAHHPFRVYKEIWKILKIYRLVTFKKCVELTKALFSVSAKKLLNALGLGSLAKAYLRRKHRIH